MRDSAVFVRHTRQSRTALSAGPRYSRGLHVIVQRRCVVHDEISQLAALARTCMIVFPGLKEQGGAVRARSRPIPAQDGAIDVSPLQIRTLCSYRIGILGGIARLHVVAAIRRGRSGAIPQHEVRKNLGGRVALPQIIVNVLV